MRRDSSGSRSYSSAYSALLLLSNIVVTSTSLVGASWSDRWTKALQQAPLLSLPFPPTRSKDLVKQDYETEFTLRHIYENGIYDHPGYSFQRDVDPAAVVWITNGLGGRTEKGGSFRTRSTMITIERMLDRRIDTIQPFLTAARLEGHRAQLSPSAWTTDLVSGPDVTDKETVLGLANMAANSYIQMPDTENWSNVSTGLNQSIGFGWEGDNLRGHVFATKDNSSIVIAIKGTSLQWVSSSETTANDKINDNLFGSCCCAQGGQYLWQRVCDCMSTTYTCNQTCLEKALRKPSRYYQTAIEMYGNVSELYPTSSIWLVGHSLGGVVAALLGLTFGLPTVTFEAYGDQLAASRLGLPSPPKMDPEAPQHRTETGIYHFGHTADPIFMGTCNGASAGCTLWGYSFESQCHTGKTCTYDTVEDKGWRVSVGAHRIRSVIPDVIAAYDDVPECHADTDCIDCFNWKYFESNDSRTTTSSFIASSTTSTRTSTCMSPGWWGCRDESTTTTQTTSSKTNTLSTSTSTCKTPGWFGCNDLTTTTTTTTTSSSTNPSPTAISSSSEEPLISTTCPTPGLVWGCRSASTTTIPTAHPMTSAPVYAELR
ncbi:putative lipase atg15 [Bachmanniomyces sp. S44760]|nr:putative lipase atg15 [Bachmanniomyces sp. S44760]